MKKLIAWVVLTGAGLGVSGCGEAPAPTAKPTTPPASTGPSETQMQGEKGEDRPEDDGQ
ncbi:MAG: hypothetical protein ACT4QC_11170 [Planctomycetaceae bacterium]